MADEKNEKTVEIEGAGEVNTENKEIALLIAVLALVLAIAELLGSSAQTRSVQANIEQANLWSFYQAKSIRAAGLEATIDLAEADMHAISDPRQKEAREALVSKWKKSVAHYESDTEKNNGKEQLAEQAKEAVKERDLYEKKHARFELATGAFHIAIVLASATIITGIPLLVYGAGFLGLVGLINVISGWLL